MNVEKWSENHRCKGSLEAHVRIARDYKDMGYVFQGWHIFKREYRYEDWTPCGMSLGLMHEITHCPYCGEELDKYWKEDEILEANRWARKQGWSGWKMTLTSKGYRVEKL